METVIVSNSQFYSHYPRQIPKGSVNAEQVEIRLDKSWDGLTVRIHWLNVASNVERKPLLERDKPNTIPWEVLTDLGELRMGLVGLDGETVIKPTIWLTYGYVSDGVDPESGSDPQPPTPSWEQQMVEQATAAANAAKEAKETADNLQAAAEAGEFDGDPGPAGPPGKSPIIRNGTWWIWNNDSQDYTDTGVIASGGGGGGVSSYNDLSDRPTIGGVLLEGNKTAQELNLQPAGEYLTDSDVPDWAKQPEKPKYTPEEVGAQPAGNYLQDGDVPSWAMQPQKPTYTAQEVGAQPKGDYAQKSDIPEKLPNPQALTINGQTYDGSQPVTVELPGGISDDNDWVLLAEETLAEAVSFVKFSGDWADYKTFYCTLFGSMDGAGQIYVNANDVNASDYSLLNVAYNAAGDRSLIGYIYALPGPRILGDYGYSTTRNLARGGGLLAAAKRSTTAVSYPITSLRFWTNMSNLEIGTQIKVWGRK